jgi:hypothetical protein
MQTNIFDVPVYRLKQDRYNAELDEYIERTMYPPNDPWSEATRELDKRQPHLRINFHDHLWRSYGGAWRFNEIIAYIRLHFLGSQIRGEYFSSIRKRCVRTRTKTFEYRTHKLAAEIDIPRDADKKQIFDLFRQYLEDCQRELPKRYVDITSFEEIAPYVDWRALFDDHLETLRQRVAAR